MICDDRGSATGIEIETEATARAITGPFTSQQRDKNMPDQTTADFQRQCDEFVNREVYVRQNHAMTMNQEPYSNEFYDLTANLTQYTCPHCEETLPEDIPAASEDHSEFCFQCPMCSEPFDEPEMNDQEVFEWWAVSSYLADKLQERGEVMYDGDDCKIWGRCTSGQAISIDGVIEDIVKELNA